MKKCAVCEREISEVEYKEKNDEIGETNGDIICPDCMKTVDEGFAECEESEESKKEDDENDKDIN